MSRKAVVVGAGPGGLATAMILSRKGLDVTVLEKRDCVGGRTSSLGANGYTFDLGPTFFLYPEVIEEVFKDCGLVFEGNDSIVASPDPAHMESEFARLSPRDAGSFTRYMDDNRRKFESFRPILERPVLSWTNLVDPGLLKLLPYLRPTRSVENDLSRFFEDERLRLTCCFQS